MTTASFPIIDSHVHFGHPNFGASLMKILGELDTPRLNIVCTPHEARLSLVPDALHLKAHHPEQVYVFGGLDISPLFIAPREAGGLFADYAETLLALGCDGIKMIEGKPDTRKTLPIPPFDGEVYAPYWERMEARGIPLVFHVNDPAEFWDADKVPGWAREQGWFYGDGTYINNEAQYTEVLNVLARHPRLKVIFAHFFFLSAQLPRLAGYLDQFPNMCVDLTPGIEMYQSFARAPADVREFFIKYQDRIVYGTDIGAYALLATPDQGVEAGESASRVQLVRGFLETDGPFWPPAGGFLFGRQMARLQGIGLPREALEKIYFRNFERLAGATPRPLDPAAIIAECERLILMIRGMGQLPPCPPVDTSIAQMVKGFFESRC
jgi:predicted TIM-barrel fold metal-dependent hydrolase